MSLKGKDVSIIIPALNEEENIKPTVMQVLLAAQSQLNSFEIILVNDGSTDQTGHIMENLALENDKIRVLHNTVNLGLGGAYKKGLAAASLAYVSWCASDNDFPSESMSAILEKVGQADLIIPYQRDMQHRSWLRRVLSFGYTEILNLIFNLKLKYYNSAVVFPTKPLQEIDIKSDNFAFQSEALIKLLKLGLTYVEVGVKSTERKSGRSKALHFRNFIGVFLAVYNIWIEVYFKTSNRKV